MRISKVKVTTSQGHEEMVLMQRHNENGMLVYSSDSRGNVSRTEEIIPKKKNSFNLSIQNKTLAKPKKRATNEYNALRDLVNEKDTKWNNLENINIERLTKEFLNQRFRKTFKYRDGSDKEEIKFNLAELIMKAIEGKNTKPLNPYYQWKAWFIRTKSANLTKSIEKNRIQLDSEDINQLSHRKQALRQWAGEFAKTGMLDLTNIQSVYDLDGLVTLLHKERLETDENGKNKYNEYHCALKKTLQTHQKKLFGLREEPNKDNRENVQLYVYNMEVAKYLEHYFPVKKSTRRTSEEGYYSYYLCPGVIRETVRHQIENAVRLDRIQQGKFEHHECNKPQVVNSNRLSGIKADETFALHLSEACAFAANNIRNMMDRSETGDVLTKNPFERCLEKEFDNRLFCFFYNTADKLPDESDKWAMQKAVARIRNEVVHYRKNALKEIFTCERDTDYYTNTIFKQCLERDKANMPNDFAEQLNTGKVLSYYPMPQLQEFLSRNTFYLYRSVLPFAPGFKNVVKAGRGHQYPTDDSDFYDLELTYYPEKKDRYEDGDAYEARYFLMKLIYNNMFLPKFTEDNSQLFRDSAKYVREKNQEHADEKARKKAKAKKRDNWQKQRAKAWAFKEVPEMAVGTSVRDYMAKVQSNLMLEYNKKKDELEQQAKQQNSDDAVQQNFKKFLLQVFVKGFDTYIKQQNLSFIANTKKQEGRPDDLEKEIVESCRRAVNSSAINADDNSHIAFYTFCKLLDANHLSTLRNELLKYESATGEGKIAQDNIRKTRSLLAIIELCLFSADTVSPPSKKNKESEEDKENEEDKRKRLDAYKDYIKAGTPYREWSIYNQQAESDKVTPVIHRTIELSRNYGTEALLKFVIGQNSRFFITQCEYDEWQTFKDEKIGTDGMSTKRVLLHDEWVKAKSEDDKIKDSKKRHFVIDFMAQHQHEYQDLCTNIDRYDWLDNKLKFEHLRRLHSLTIEILARLCGFVTLWERDFHYLYTKVKSEGLVQEELNFSYGLPKLKENSEDEEFYRRTFGYNANNRDTRNYIAHFNYLTTTASKYSLLELINCVRKMLAYDRKLKNAVTKAFIKLFNKHGMVLKLKREQVNGQERFAVESISPKDIYHLGTKGKNAVKTPQVTEDFCLMCKALLELKNKDNKNK